jgi:hypothetical protein
MKRWKLALAALCISSAAIAAAVAHGHQIAPGAFQWWAAINDTVVIAEVRRPFTRVQWIDVLGKQQIVVRCTGPVGAGKPRVRLDVIGERK